MNKTTRVLNLALGLIAGIMGIEHGIGEVLEGNRPTEGIFILSWPDSAFFAIMAGEPAMTVIPNYLLTGLLAIFFSSIFLMILVRPGPDTKFAPIQCALLVLMLFTGAGFGPPLTGFIAVLIGLKRNSPLRTWSRLPSNLHRVLRALWPWSFGLCLIGWLMMFPGVSLISLLTGLEHDLLMILPIAIAFLLIPITLLLGFSRDVLDRMPELLKPA